MENKQVFKDETKYCQLLSRDITLGYCAEIGLLRYDGQGGESEETFVDSMGIKEIVFETIRKIGYEESRQLCNGCMMVGLYMEEREP